MAVSEYARKASTTRGAQFDSTGPRNLPRNKSCTNGVKSSPHSHGHWWRVPSASKIRLASVKKAQFVAGDCGGATLLRRCWAKRQHFTCLESKLDPLVTL